MFTKKNLRIWVPISLLLLMVFGLLMIRAQMNIGWKTHRYRGIISSNSFLTDIDMMVGNESSNIWVLADSSINHHNGFYWEHFKKNELPLIVGARVTTLALDSKSRLWVGYNKPIIQSFDGNNWFTYEIPETLFEKRFSKEINAIAYDEKQDQLWVATSQHGIYILNNNSWTHFSSSNPAISVNKNRLQNVKNHPVNTITFDNQGRVWVGSEKSGLLIINDDSWYIDEQYGDVHVIAFDQVGRAWLGTSNGVIILNKGELDSPQGKMLSGANITHISFDSQQRAWIGMGSDGPYNIESLPFEEQTLAIYDVEKGHVQSYHQGNSGIFGNSVKDIIMLSNQGEVWIATDKGISIVAPTLGKAHNNLAQLEKFGWPFFTLLVLLMLGTILLICAIFVKDQTVKTFARVFIVLAFVPLPFPYPDGGFIPISVIWTLYITIEAPYAAHEGQGLIALLESISPFILLPLAIIMLPTAVIAAFITWFFRKSKPSNTPHYN